MEIVQAVKAFDGTLFATEAEAIAHESEVAADLLLNHIENKCITSIVSRDIRQIDPSVKIYTSKDVEKYIWDFMPNIRKIVIDMKDVYHVVK